MRRRACGRGFLRDRMRNRVPGGIFRHPQTLSPVRPFLLSLALLACASAPSAQQILPGQFGADLLGSLADGYKPSSVLSDAASKDRLYDTVERYERNGQAGSVGLYTDHFVPFDGNPNTDPSQDVFNNGSGLNQEHVWPRSEGTDGNTAERDMHHLYPTRVVVNSDRGNLPFGEVPDASASAWYYLGQTQSTAPPETTRDLWSERQGTTRFEPREDKKGDVARALFYVRMAYGPEQGTSPLDINWFNAQLGDLLAWHAADPATDDERARSGRVAQFQSGCSGVTSGPAGCQNPFAFDESLARRAFDPNAVSAEPGAGVAGLRLVVPSPVLGAVSVQVAAARPVHARVVVYDLLGRQVAVLLDGSVTGTREVQTGALAPGLYLVRTLADGRPLGVRRAVVTR